MAQLVDLELAADGVESNGYGLLRLVGAGPFVVTELNGEAWIPSWHGRDVWRLSTN